MTSSETLQKQKEFFASGATFDLKFRKQSLKKLASAICMHKKDIFDALKKDLGKCETESQMCEVGMVLGEIKYQLSHLRHFARKNRVPSGLANFPSKSYSVAVPKGSVLVMSPWNYPVMLTLEPLVDAMAAGNTVVVKPSAYAPESANVIKTILEETFSPEYVAVVLGGRAENQDLLSLPFDHIFFTGSKAVGHEVLKKAEEYLTPVTLELGGKSPCVVAEDANIRIAARRIVFGKLMNVGQTCVAPDYVLVQKKVKDKLLEAIKDEIKSQYGTNFLQDVNYGKIVSEKHFDRLVGLLSDQKIVFGGKFDRESLKIEPTILDEPKMDSPVMLEEIFGPILPVLSYETKEDALAIIAKNPTPLALYVFSENKNVQNFFLGKIQFGGGCVNDTLVHLVSPSLAFGGVGTSGLGAYHGKRGFDTFSHHKSIVKKSTKIDVPVRYRPFSKAKKKIIKKML